ncbi:MAG: ubiquinone biosynthesis protein [Cyanobacteria bacterium RI_101]|nr:ubiquinone biosynthesis protein [Cyanobacteria bacterium RI_101]
METLNSARFNASMNNPREQQTPNLLSRGLKSAAAKVLLVKSFVAMLLGDNSLKTVGELTYGLLGTRAYDLAARHLRQDPACAALIRDRYIPPAHDLDALLTLPPDSLGAVYATQLKTLGFDPNLHAGMTAQSDAEYVELRLSQTHDLWHILTGFDTSFIGEIGLQAFHLPQFPYPLATLLIANSLITATLKEPELLPQLLAAVAQGFQMGKTARPLFAQKWEEGWEKPLSQWRAELRIEPI